jgi:hypothetical protein
MDLVFFNPNKSRLKFKWAKGDTWIEGDSVGHFILDSASAIPSNAEFRLPARLILDTKKMLKASPALLANKEVKIKINGTASVG